MATKGELRREIRELRNVGYRMSNMLFNWSQSSECTDRDTMRLLYKEWDGIKRAEPVVSTGVKKR